MNRLNQTESAIFTICLVLGASEGSTFQILLDYNKYSKDYMGLDTDDDEFEETKEFPEALGARLKEKKIPTLDLDTDIDTNVLEEYKYYKPSKMFDFFTADKSDPDKIKK